MFLYHQGYAVKVQHSASGQLITSFLYVTISINNNNGGRHNGLFPWAQCISIHWSTPHGFITFHLGDLTLKSFCFEGPTRPKFQASQVELKIGHQQTAGPDCPESDVVHECHLQSIPPFLKPLSQSIYI